MSSNTSRYKDSDTIVTPQLPLIELAGNRRVCIERHSGVLGYDHQCVCVRLSFGLLYINGTDLGIIHMTKSQIVVKGEICSILIKRC